MFLLIEFVLCLFSLVAAFLVPDLGKKWFSRVECGLNRLAQRRGWAVVSVGLTALALRAALLPIEPIPQPQVHDEFSYLLMADTFAHGRLANPTHPMWVHFETFHVNQNPTYVSMYYPAQGIFLAAGQVLFGHPFWGVWLSVGIMCAAICWMLQAWLPPFWALLGGLLAVIRLGTFSYWADSYWGGAIAAIGGALVLGGFPRIKKYCRARDAVILGLGFVILANSRPFEGLFLSFPVLGYLLKWLSDRKFPIKFVIHRIVLPLCVVMSVGAAGMLYYFWRTTGSPFILPYSVNLRAYNPIPFFPWQQIRPTPEYHHSAMRDFYFEWWFPLYTSARSHPVILAVWKAYQFSMFFAGTVLLFLVIMSFVATRSWMSWNRIGPRTRQVLLIILFGVVADLLPIFVNLHYAAPFVGAFYLLVVFAVQRVRRWSRHGQRTGVAALRFTAAICILMFVLRVRADSLHIPTASGIPTWYSPPQEIPGRVEVLNQLNQGSGKMLVIVRYHTPRNRDLTRFEWVYNSADIDGSKIVWARDMGAERNQELLNYFKDREVWLVEPDEVPVRLSLYASSRAMK